MLFTTALLAIIAVPALALPKVETRQDLPDYPYDLVNLISPHPTAGAHWCEGHEIDFKWSGGSGNYRLTLARNYPGIHVWDKPTVLAENTTATTWVSTVPNSAIDKITYIYRVEDVGGVAYNDPDNKHFAETLALPLAGPDRTLKC